MHQIKSLAITARALAVVAVMLALLPAARAQDYPARQITIVFPGGAGIAPDRMARTLADKLREKWGQPVVVENKPGAGGNLGGEYVAKSAPDGYTLLFTGAGALVLGKMIYSKLNYDPEAFVPVSLSVQTPMVMVVHAKVPAQNLQQLIALAKASPEKLNYGSAGAGTTTHLAGELLKSMAGVKLTHIPYKGLAPALTDLLGAQVDMVVMDIGTALTNVRAGKIRALAVTTGNRSALLPEVPAVGEVLKGYEATFAFGLVAPQGTPAAIVSKLSAAAAEGMKQPDIVKQWRAEGTEIVGSTSAEMAQFLAAEKARWSGVVRDLNLKAD